jgi:parvulin-like peptidyl-prolyl isomerase
MRTRPRRRALAFGACLLAATLASTACENPADPDAARVNGTDISSEALRDTADVYAALPGDPYGLAADTAHAYSGSGMATVLSDRIVDRIVLDAAQRYGLTPDQQLVDQIDQQLASSTSGQGAALNQLPADRRQAFIEARALESQLFQYVATNQWWNDEEAAIFDELVADGTIASTSCVHHILVDSEAEADDILDQLDDGGDFEQLAGEHSIDTGSAQTGGDLGCNPEGSFVQPFEDAIRGAKAGDVVGPVQTDFGFHIIRIDSPLAPPTIETSGSDGWLAVLRRTTDVHVDPRYGTWDSSTFTVTPPQGAASAGGALNLGL